MAQVAGALAICSCVQSTRRVEARLRGEKRHAEWKATCMACHNARCGLEAAASAWGWECGHKYARRLGCSMLCFIQSDWFFLESCIGHNIATTLASLSNRLLLPVGSSLSA
jgi:hypothetical protein